VATFVLFSHPNSALFTASCHPRNVLLGMREVKGEGSQKIESNYGNPYSL
jgi:hypothetical protein